MFDQRVRVPWQTFALGQPEYFHHRGIDHVATHRGLRERIRAAVIGHGSCAIAHFCRDAAGTRRATERLQQARVVAVPWRHQRCVRRRSDDDDRRTERQVQEGVVQGGEKPVDRLLLCVPDGLARSNRQQRHDRGTGRAERHPAAVRALLVRVPPVRAAVSTGHVDGIALRHRRQGHADRSAARIQRRARGLEPLSQDCQPRPWSGARRPLAGFGRAAAADPQRDRRQAGAGQARSPRCCSARTCRSRKARTSARSRTSRCASRRRRPVARLHTRPSETRFRRPPIRVSARRRARTWPRHA